MSMFILHIYFFICFKMIIGRPLNRLKKKKIIGSVPYYMYSFYHFQLQIAI